VRDEQIKSLSVTCQCGKVELRVTGAPILAASCHCTSCRRAGRTFEELPSAPPVLDPDGGSPVLLYRKDRVRCVTGRQYLEEHRLKPDSPSRRVLASCCNSAMFGDFTKGHWLSLYRQRFPAGVPPVEMRIMTRDRDADVVLGDDVPNHSGFPARFLWKLLLAWIAMGFRKPDMGMGHLNKFKSL
jgi:hypothetical protein